MGRELKRVPLDFDWPKGKIWEGYINPHYHKCPDCERGYSPAGEWLMDVVQKMVWDLPKNESGRAEAVALTTVLCGRPPVGALGHDSCDAYGAKKFICKAAGMPENWGICKTCGGDAIDPKFRKQYEEWKRSDPPIGPGFQLWETTSEGSPMSPVFETLDALCEWAEKNASTFADYKTTAAEWKRMLGEDFVTTSVGRMVFL